MRTETGNRSGAIRPLLVCLAVLVFSGLPGMASSLISAAPGDGGDVSTAGEKAAGFVYRLENRPDPFVPFITEKAVSAPTVVDEIIEEDVELTGMRRFEPGQLKLVAVLFSGKKKIAMVEDVTGRGYILTEGTPIGRHGVVTKIVPQQLQITETLHTRLGKKLVNTVVMRLNTEGDK